MKKRNIADKRNFETMTYNAEKQVRRGRLTLADYNEIFYHLPLLWAGDTVKTINTNVSEFFKLYGVHVEENGIGWMLNY